MDDVAKVFRLHCGKCNDIHKWQFHYLRQDETHKNWRDLSPYKSISRLRLTYTASA